MQAISADNQIETTPWCVAESDFDAIGMLFERYDFIAKENFG